MLIFFGVFEVELDSSADVIISLIDGEFASFAFFVFIFEDFLIGLFIESDIDVNGAGESSEEAGDFILRVNKKLPLWD